LTTESLNLAYNLIKFGDAHRARRLLTTTLKEDPHCEMAWTLLFFCFEAPQKQQFCLQKVLEINPYNDKARRVLCSLSAPTHAAPDIASSSPLVSGTVDHKPNDHPHKRASLASKMTPQEETLMNPALQALKELGGSASIEELYTKVIEIANIPDELIKISHDPEGDSQLKIEDRRTWSRSYLKKVGLIENSAGGVWALTSNDRQTEQVDPQEVSGLTHEQRLHERPQGTASRGEIDQGFTWRDELLSTLNKMEAPAFESLILRMLMESGYIQAEARGGADDEGIDGKGIMRIGGLLSFHVLIQCKCYQGPVTPGDVRGFHEAMAGRAYKGLLVTTGAFSMEAVKEAARDDATAIDLIDGELLADKLKELGLGVTTQIIEVEKVIIDKEWLLGTKPDPEN